MADTSEQGDMQDCCCGDMQDRLEQALLHPETLSSAELDALLSDEDFREQYVMAKDAECAMRGRCTDFDAAGAFARFQAEHGYEKQHHRMRIVYLAIIGIAASLLAVYLLRPTNEPAPPPAEKPMVAGQVYAAQQTGNDIIITTNDKITKISGARPGQVAPNITLTATGDIVCQKVEADEAGDITSTITVPHGKVAHIVLPDGTNAWLNAESSLSYPVAFPDEGARRVTLEGEAYLEVTHDAQHPFIVEAGGLQTEVLGTSFNIRSYSGEPAQVTLVTGRIRVSDGNRAVVLVPGQMADGGTMRVRDVYTDDYTCWKDGRFAFSEQSLRSVMIEIGRWYNMNVIFEDSSHARDKIHFSGMRDWSIDEIVSQVNQLLDIDIKTRGNSIIVK